MPAQGGSVRAGPRVEESTGLPSALYRHGGFASGDRARPHVRALRMGRWGDRVPGDGGGAPSRPKP